MKSVMWLQPHLMEEAFTSRSRHPSDEILLVWLRKKEHFKASRERVLFKIELILSIIAMLAVSNENYITISYSSSATSCFYRHE